MASSSVIVTAAPVTVMPVAEPVIETVSSGSSRTSWVGVILSVPVCERLFAGIVIVIPVTGAKSVPEVAVPEVAVTDTAVAASRVPPFKVAVTVMGVAAAASLTDVGNTVSVTPLEGVSSSSTATSTDAAVTTP